MIWRGMVWLRGNVFGAMLSEKDVGNRNVPAGRDEVKHCGSKRDWVVQNGCLFFVFRFSPLYLPPF